MAFNPIGIFRKYQRFWMAAVLLMCMLSFVVCSGDKGGPQDYLIGWTRNKGPIIAKIDGVSYHSTEMHDLKTKRQVANDYMKKTLEKLKQVADKKIEQYLADKAMDMKAREAKIFPVKQTKEWIERRLKRTRFFDGGVKLDDLVDFKLWLLEADRLKVPDMQGYILRLLDGEFQLQQNQVTGYTYEILREVLIEVRSNFNVSEKFVWQAIANEYRVKMAKLAMITTQPSAFSRSNDRAFEFFRRHNVARNPFEPFKEPVNQRGTPYPYDTVRVPVSPAQLYDIWKEKRTEFDLLMVPVLAEDFLNSKDLAPTESELHAFFEENKKKRYEPTTEDSGFEVPAQIKVTVVSANPDLPKFKALARYQATMKFYPLPEIPSGPGLAFAAPLIAGQLGGAVKEKEFYQVEFNNTELRNVQAFLGPPLASGNFQAALLAFEAYEIPQAHAAVIGALARADGPLAAPAAFLNVANFMHGGHVFQRQQQLKAQIAGAKDETLRKKLEAELKDLDEEASFPGLDNENRRLLRDEAERQAFLGAALAGIGPQPWPLPYPAFDVRPTLLFVNQPSWIKESNAAPKEADKAASSGLEIDIPNYKIPKYRKQYERQLAIEEARNVMEAVRKALQAERISGDGAALNRALTQDLAGLPFQIETTSKMYNRYDIKDAPELKTLLDSYEKWHNQINIIEGREPETALKDADFDKILFDKGESFLMADGRSEKSGVFDVHAFPPVLSNKSGKTFINGQEVADQAAGAKQVTIDLFPLADNPILFWISKKESARFPEKLANPAELGAQEKDLQEKIEKALFEGGVCFKNKETFTALATAMDKLHAERILRERVEKAWKTKRAREKLAIPEVARIAAELQKRTDSPANQARDQVDRLNKEFKIEPPRKVLEMDNIAPLVPIKADVLDKGLITGYSSVYSLPNNKILRFPTEQMPQQLLMFGNPKSFLKTDYKPIDDLNEKLFKDYQESVADKTKSKLLVQVFTNKPRDRFFVAVLGKEPSASLKGFFASYSDAFKIELVPGQKEMLERRRERDPFIFEAYNGVARHEYEVMMKELREIRGVWVTEDAEERKRFDTGD